jgi:hypothetical protein
MNQGNVQMLYNGLATLRFAGAPLIEQRIQNEETPRHDRHSEPAVGPGIRARSRYQRHRR